jgi:hypothetical protein
MAKDSEGGGFGWGFVIGGMIGLMAGAYLASGPGREQVEGLRQRTVELTGGGDELKARARAAAARAGEAMRDPDNPMRRAIQDGVEAARRRKQELEAQAREQSAASRAETGAADGREGA